jgi:hypothetical protein
VGVTLTPAAVKQGEVTAELTVRQSRRQTSPALPSGAPGTSVSRRGDLGDELDLEAVAVLEVCGVVVRAAGERMTVGEEQRPSVSRRRPSDHSRNGS